MVSPGFPHGVRFGRAFAGILCAAAILSLVGCGGGGPKLVKVTGKIYYQDKPYPQAHVWFAPESPSDGQLAQATADQDGSFTMTTPNAGDGVIPGRYKVGLLFGTKGKEPPRGLQKYSSSKTTPITVDVPPEGLTDYEIRLK